nr:helix-turn-helix domain-containing protein [Streptomyces sp. HUCO-GS316]
MTTPAADLAALGKLTGSQREGAMRRFAVLRPHLEDGVPLARAAAEAGVAYRTAQRWAAAYRDRGLAGLIRAPCLDTGHRRVPEELRHLVEGLALRRPAPHVTWVHRRVAEVAKEQGWPVPSYSTVYAIVRALDPALVVLAREGAKRYREVYDLIHPPRGRGPQRRLAGRPHPTRPVGDRPQRQAGTALANGRRGRLLPRDRRVRGQPRCPVRAEHRARAAPVDLAQAGPGLAHLRQPRRLLHRPRLRLHLRAHGAGRRRTEDPVNTLCLSDLPGYAPRGTKDRAGQARLSLAELDRALGAFFVGTYNQREHGETGHPPQARWEAGAFLPHMPDALEQLDLLLLTVAKPARSTPTASTSSPCATSTRSWPPTSART